MSLSDRITGDIGHAMKAREQTRLSALRMAKAALMNASVAKGRDLEDGEAQQVLMSLLKQRRDSIEQFTAAGRTDLADRERAELAVLEAYAPPSVGPEALSAAVAEAVAAYHDLLTDEVAAETGASTRKDLGRVMKAVMSRLEGQTVDGKAVNELVRSRLPG